MFILVIVLLFMGRVCVMGLMRIVVSSLLCLISNPKTDSYIAIVKLINYRCFLPIVMAEKALYTINTMAWVRQSGTSDGGGWGG